MLELLLVVMVIAILTALVMPYLSRARAKAEYIRWATSSQSMTLDPELPAYFDFQPVAADSRTLRNRAQLGVGSMGDRGDAGTPGWGRIQLASAGATLSVIQPLGVYLIGSTLPQPSQLDGTLGKAGDPASIPQWVPGRWPETPKQGLRFGRIGPGSYSPRTVVRIRDNKLLDLAGGDFTIIAWFKPEAHVGTLLFKMEPGGGAGFCAYFYSEQIWFTARGKDPDGGPGQGQGQGHGQGIATISLRATLPDASDWHQLAVTRNTREGRIALYLDGVEQDHNAGEDVNLNLGCSTDLLLGQSIGSGYGGGYMGLLDELGIWRRPMAAEEIERLYEAGKPSR